VYEIFGENVIDLHDEGKPLYGLWMIGWAVVGAILFHWSPCA
jgi:hypothetical protein